MMHVFAQMLLRLTALLSRSAHALERTLPALLPVTEMDRLVREHYTAHYEEDRGDGAVSPEPPGLAAWESLVLDRYKVNSGHMLVLGAGWGRESIAAARRGVRVAGLDTNFAALRWAARLAGKESVPALFQQGDFLALPYVPASFDCLLLSCNMYSAIPGCAQRQAWLGRALELLKPDGKLMVSFLPRQQPPSRLRALSDRLNRVVMRLPGANHEYQVGDICYAFHYLHEFQDQEELVCEVGRAGAAVLEVNWGLGYAVLGR